MDDDKALVPSRKDDQPKALTEREQGVMIVSGAVGLGIGAVVALVATWASWAGFFTAVGTLANVIMAGAAIAAFGLWRAQLHGGSAHEVAKKVRLLAYKSELTLRKIVADLSFAHVLSDPTRRADENVSIFLKRANSAVVEVDAELKELAIEARVVWAGEASPLDGLMELWSEIEMGVSLASMLCDGAVMIGDTHASVAKQARAFLGVNDETHKLRQRLADEVKRVEAWSAPYIGSRR